MTERKLPQPFSVDKIWIPTDFTRFGESQPTLVNVAGCENSEASPKAMAVLKEVDPRFLIDHWESQDPTLRSKLAELHDVEPKQVFLTAGAIEGIRYAFDVFVDQKTNVGLLQPDFPGFIFFARRAKAPVSLLETLQFPFQRTTGQIAAFVDKEAVDFLIISNPSAVTGTRRSREEIEDLVEKAPNTLIVVDEADAIDTNSVSHLTKVYENLIVLRSFSKFYGLSGLRVGYLVTPPAFIEDFDKTINPVELTSFGILAATAAVDDFEYQKQTQERVAQNLSLLTQACEETPYQLVPGSECFAAYLWADETVEDPYSTLQKHGIKIAKGSDFGIARGGRVNLSNSEHITKLAQTTQAIPSKSVKVRP